MHGLIVLDKPAGVSSHEALAPVKQQAGRKVRVGHAGTLDPFATGILLVLLGDATRLAEYAVGLEKTYEARVAFGVATDTYDPEGAETERVDPGPAPPPAFPAVLARFEGDIQQAPPAFSAVKVGGRRAYRLAREGSPPELPPRPVRIHAIRVLEVAWPEVVLEVRCGAGTYLRSLARDVGAALGFPAHLRALRRTVVGPFRVEDADPGRVLPPLRIVRAAGMPEVRLDPAALRLFAAGTTVPAEVPADTVAVLPEGREILVGIGRPDPVGGMAPAKVLAAARDEVGS